MIDGFETETAPLSEYEKSLVAPMIAGLKTKLGQGNAITNKVICAKMKTAGYKCTPVRVRKIINHIRTKRLLHNLVASSRGYYIETDPVKILAYKKSLKERAKAILAVSESFIIENSPSKQGTLFNQ